jgi:ABC-type transporter Mla MlaB component
VTQPRSGAPSTARSSRGGIALAGRIGPSDAAALSACVCARVAAGERGALACDVAELEEPDLGTVEALARMALTARRLGRRVELRRVQPELRELLELAGLGGLARAAARTRDARTQATLTVEGGGASPPVRGGRSPRR